MKSESALKIENLMQKGVEIPNPQSVEIGPEVNIDKISGEGVVIYSFRNINDFQMNPAGFLRKFNSHI